MGDMTVETAFTCCTNLEWSTAVIGSVPRGETEPAEYTVSWGRSKLPDEPFLFRWSCTCPSFTYHKHGGVLGVCKHIDGVEESKLRCAWNSALEPTAEPAIDESNDPACPDCGGPVQNFTVAV